jgi:surface antigen
LLAAVTLALTATAASLVPTGEDSAHAATVGVLCSGFAACTDAGMSESGYHAVWNKMFWNMYAGSNCTNYVAYRMIKAGMSSTRPAQLKPGKGNATYWGTSFSSQTNQTPTVGAVAWWKANAPGAGSAGHVAYVEKVYSSSDIVVSESNWAGNFDWRRITKSANWPTGFIHLHDAGTPKPTPPPPVMKNTAVPTISGTVAVGQALAATPGSWSQTPTKVSYQWYGNGVAFSGATSSTINLGPTKLGKRISVKVTATSAAGSASATSTATPAVILGTVGVTTPPRITGTPRIDETLTAVAPVTTKSFNSKTVQWYADGVAIPGATGWTLTLGPDEVAKQITVQVHGKRNAFKDVIVTSAPTDLVQAPPIEVAPSSGVIGAPQIGTTLRANPAVIQPAAVQATYTWLRDGQPVPGATAPTYPLTPSDFAHRIGVRVTLTAPGYYPLTREYAVSTPVAAVAKLKVKASPGRRSATVAVRVKALGELIKGGYVTARVGKHKATAKVRGKQVVLHLSGLTRGTRVLRIQYDGTKRYAAVALKQPLRVR